jgi:hypothetical protein
MRSVIYPKKDPESTSGPLNSDRIMIPAALLLL